MKTINCSRLHSSKMNKLPSSVLNPIHTYPMVTLGIVVCGMLTLIAAFLCMCRKSQSFGNDRTLEEFRQAMQAKMEEVQAWGDAQMSAAGILYDDTSSTLCSDDCFASLEIKNEIRKTPVQSCGGGGDADCLQVETEQTMDVEKAQGLEGEEAQAKKTEEMQAVKIDMESVEVKVMQAVGVEDTLVVKVKDTD